MTNEKCNNWMQTFTGEQFDPLNPDPDKINILDIGHALSNLCRYGGHCSKFYSVAQHCVIVANYIYKITKSKQKAMAGLLHDASEAYLVDIPRPIKQRLKDYNEYEDFLLKVIFKKFNAQPYTDIVHEIDMRVLMTEAKYLMGDPKNWNIPYEPIDEVVLPMSSTYAKEIFYNTFNLYLTDINTGIEKNSNGLSGKK